MLVVRPGTPADLDALMELARLSGPGFTSLPADSATLIRRLALSEASFAGAVPAPAAWYTLMLEETESGRVEGVAAVRACIDLDRPHFSFRLLSVAQRCSATGARFDLEALLLVAECAGHTEIGSLFLKQDRRGGGAGSLLARARYMLIAADPARFSEALAAQLRGWFDDDGRSPFWEGAAAPFYRASFEEAVRLATATDGQFLIDLAPRHPIYVDLLAQDARVSIGKAHRGGKAARAMLEREGFRFSGLVDLFDGGPTMTCARDDIATIRDSGEMMVEIADRVEGEPMLLSTTAVAGFRATRAPARIRAEAVVVEARTATALAVAQGDLIRVSRKEPRPHDRS